MSDPVKVALIGAGSRSFGPGSTRDVLLSGPLKERGVELVLMDIVEEHLADSLEYAAWAKVQLDHPATLRVTTDLRDALDGADFAVTAIEVDRFRYWAQDFHVPRRYGCRQVFGENGGVGGIFHALRNMGPMLEIARTMEDLCPDGVLLNFTNPESKLCEALTRLTSVTAVGLCHGVFMGQEQIARILGMPQERIETAASGINHFTWFQTVRDRETGEDLYPRLRQMERDADILSDWHEIGMARILLRRFGLWPAPAANHFGEYIGWANEFIADELQYFYDAADGDPWERGEVPEFVYSLSHDPTRRPLRAEPAERSVPDDSRGTELTPSGELAGPIMEALACGVEREPDAINVPNNGAIPNLPDDMVVEVPGVTDADGLRARQCEPLPEAIAALLRVQGSIHQLIVEAFAEQSRDKLLQAVLLDPTVDSYRGAVAMTDEMLRLQADILPPIH